MTDAPDVFAPGINFSLITKRVVLGSRPLSVAHLELLRQQAGITHILNVCEVDDLPLLRSVTPLCEPGHYLFNPTPDDGQPKAPAFFQRSLRFMLPVLAVFGTVMYVHCESGMDRSAATAYAWLISQGFSPFEVVLKIKEHRPIALWRYIGDADKAVAQGW